MDRLSLLLFLVASISTTTAMFVVLVDSSNCVHIRCEWRGEGKNCKSGTLIHLLTQQNKIPDATPLNYRLISDYEPETSILARIKLMYPLNTFTLVDDDVAMDEKCTGRRLWCNDSGMYGAGGYDDFLETMQTRKRSPKFEC